MRRFSVSTLLWFISACAVVILVLTTQRSLREKVFQLKELNSVNASLRDRLGEFKKIKDNECYIKYFKDPYSYDREYRWRIKLPDASLCKISYAVGKLPQNGLPESSQSIHGTSIHGTLEKGPAELILIVESSDERDDVAKHFRLALYPEYASGDYAGHYTYLNSKADWIPDQRKENTLESPPLDATTAFSLDEPFVIMKHFSVNDDGEKIGYLVWIERREAENDKKVSRTIKRCQVPIIDAETSKVSSTNGTAG